MEKIDVDLRSVKKILSDDDYFYQVPDYQRPYSWDKENVSELIDDLFFAFINNNDEDYFCGSLVLVHNNRYDIIDGQQRLTTFTILACVIRDTYLNSLTEKAKDYILNSIQDKYDSDKRRLKFLTSEQFQVDFEQTILNGITFNDSIKSDKEFNNNRYLQNAYYLKLFIEEKITEQNVNISNFIVWVYEKVVMTVIITKNLDNAIRIFNVLNDRGMPLSPVDILKSTLMTKLSQEDRNAFKAKWDSINKSISLTETFDFEDMLNTYLYYKLGSNPSTRFDKALITIFEKEKINALGAIYEIGKFTDSYLESVNSEDKYTYLLKYLKHRIYWHSILATAYFVKYEDINKLKEVLVAYYYQNWISGATIARIKQTSFNILKAVKNHDNMQTIIKLCSDNLINYNTTDSFKNELNSSYIYGRPWDRPVLLLIEYFSQDNSALRFIPLNNVLQVEHVLPQTPDKKSEWNTLFSENEQEELTNSIGNLTLLSMRKNIQASNFTFNEKKTAYEDADNVITSFVITQKILKNTIWTPQVIDARKNDMINQIIDILSL